MYLFLYPIIIFASIGGFSLALMIYHKKRVHEKMMCHLGSNCDMVIHSEYSRFFGIPLEFLGILYYALIMVSYVLFLVFPLLATPLVTFGIFSATVAAFFFSLYLTLIQALALRQWCTWCLCSASLCTIIFASALTLSYFS